MADSMLNTGAASPRRSALAWIALGCALLFPVGVGMAGLLHPSIPAPLLITLVLLPLAAVVLGAIAKSQIRRDGSVGLGRAKAAVVLGGITLGLVLAVALLLPSLCRAREPANRIKCANNLRQIGLALDLYANDHGGRFPPTPELLITDAVITPDVFVCPSSQGERAIGATSQEQAQYFRSHPECMSYVYVAGGLSKSEIGPDRILAYEPLNNHDDTGANVLYGDLRVEFIPKKEVERLITELVTTRPATAQAGH
jgi:hypothetical protein